MGEELGVARLRGEGVSGRCVAHFIDYLHKRDFGQGCGEEEFFLEDFLGVGEHAAEGVVLEG